MNDLAAAIAPRRRIELTREPDLIVGDVSIHPTACEVTTHGRRVRLQPRVMQVLVALARAAGQPVSREALLSVCWGDVTVGDDALNRCIQRLRRMAQGEATGSFVIETIPRVGYRLTSPGAASTLGLPLLAVLPFDNLSGDPEMAHFSDGVAEEILQTVARGADLRVIGRTSSFQYRGPDKIVSRLAAELRATHVLDGSVRRDATRVRISTQLIECAGQTTLWSERFDRDLTDIFALQDEIATAVASTLKATFAPAAAVGKVDPVAYDLYLRTRASRSGRHMPIVEAIRVLERAVSLAPRLTPAWAALAYRRAHVNRGTSLDEVDITVDRLEVAAAAEQALRLDPGCGLAHAALGMLLPWGDYEGRETALGRALTIGPRDPQTAVEMGWFLTNVGRIEEGLRYAAQSLELDPLNGAAANIYSQLLAFVGRYDESQRSYAVFRETLPFSPVFTMAPLGHASLKGDWKASDDLREAAVRLEWSGKYVAQALAAADILRDPTPKGRERILAAIRERIEKTGTVPLGALVIAYKKGLADEVFSFIERASFAHLFDGDGPPPAGNYSPGVIFDRTANFEMMEDIRFVGLCAKLGLCRYWVKTGRWPDCAGDGVLPYDFKAECRRLAAPKGSCTLRVGTLSTPTGPAPARLDPHA